MAPLFNLHPCISEWSLDTEDVDNVLCVVSLNLKEKDVIQLMQSKGFVFEALPDE